MVKYLLYLQLHESLQDLVAPLGKLGGATHVRRRRGWEGGVVEVQA